MMVHDGHRERLRERFFAQGLEGFAPHEALELLLTYAIPRVNTNPIAHELINHFGSFSRVLEAHPEELMQVKGVGPQAAVFLSMLLPVYKLYQQDMFRPGVRLDNYQQLTAYCSSLFLGAAEEQLYVLCFDAQLKLLAAELISRGTPDEILLVPRQVVQALLRHRAVGAVLTHNHPGYSLFPSQEDVDITIRIRDVLEGMEIRLYDHILIAGDKSFSFNRNGYLDADRLLIEPAEAMDRAAEKPLRKLPARKK